jgi:hypothetical protein
MSTIIRNSPLVQTSRKALPSQSKTSSEVNFSDGIDTPTEALLMPMVDPLASCVVATLFGNRAKVQVESAGQKFEYAVSVGDQPKFAVPAQMNGQACDLRMEMNAADRSASVSGDSPAGHVATEMKARDEDTEGAVWISGTAGNVPFGFKNQLDISNLSPDAPPDRLPNFKCSGLFAAQPFGFDSTTGADGTTSGNGHLGAQAMQATASPGPNGTFLVHYRIGSTDINETISGLK